MLRVNHLSGFGVGGFDPDALNFFAAAGITDATQKKAVNRLVKDLKGYGIWSKCIAIYPFVGGTASTHKFNLKDPRDLDAAFRGTFAGTVTHNSNGITPNGTTGYMDLKLNPNTALSQFSTHLSFYCRTLGANEAMSDFGCYDAVPNWFDLTARYTNFVIMLANISATQLIVANTDARGHFVGTRRANNDAEIYKNAVSQDTETGTDTGPLPSQNMYLGALNNTGAATQFSNRNYAFASVGSSLTDAQVTNFYTAVQAYQTTLGRQV